MKTYLLLSILVIFLVLQGLAFGQNVIQVQAGTDQIAAALANANAGDTIELATSGGLYVESATTVIDKPVTIRAAQGLDQKPTWTTDNDKRLLTLASDLDLDGILFDGSLGAGPTEDCIRLADSVRNQNLRVNDCVFQYFDDGLGEGHAIKAGSDDGMDSLVVTNSLFQHMMHEHISLKDENPDIQPGPCKYLWVENCTFWDGLNEAIYLQSHDNVSDGTPDPKAYISNVTVVSMGSKGLYLNQIDSAVIKNSIVINSSSWEYACRIYGTNSTVKGLLYWNCPEGISLKEGATEEQLSLIQAEVDPMMADVENGDFTLDPASPAVNAGVDGVTLGDPRWYPPPPPKTIQVQAGTDQIAAALANANAGDTIELATSGGLYVESATTVIDKPVTIRAAQGLDQKPTWTTDNDKRLLTLASDLDLDGILFDGSLGAGPTEDCIRLADSVRNQNLRVNDCVFQYFDDGLGEGHAIKAGSDDGMDSLVVTNSLFQHMMHEHISLKDENPDIQPGPCKYLWVENCTFWDGLNEAIYLQSHDNVSDGTPDPKAYISNVTVVSMGSKGLYLNQIDSAVIKNSIVINSSSWEYACRIYGTNSTVKGLLYWNCPEGISLKEGATEEQLSLIQAEVDPMMADVENGDFTLDPASPAVNAGVDGVTLGDPRWYPGATAVKTKELTLVTDYQLEQNYPNPFNPSTTISYALPQKSNVLLEVFSLLGQKVTTLVNEEQQAGRYSVTWNGADYSGRPVTSGVYLYKIKADDFTSVHRMVFIK
jgi:hypothetical protein